MRSRSATRRGPRSSPGGSRSRRCSMRAWSRCRSACAPTARRDAARSRRDAWPRCERRAPKASRRSPSCSCMLTPIPRMSARRRSSRAMAGFTQISASHEVSPLVKFVGRGDTAVVDAYLSPLLRRYVDRVATALRFIAADPTPQAALHAVLGRADLRAICSGARTRSCRAPRAAWSARWRRRGPRASPRSSASTWAAPRPMSATMTAPTSAASRAWWPASRVRAPMMLIHTVAAGGGSILHYDGARFRVGPDSAGADPGPLSYRRGGPLTVTDANVMTGKLAARFLPAHLRTRAGRAARRRRRAQGVQVARPQARRRQAAPEEIADGFIRIAVENMANAIKTISVQRGYDVTEYVLNSFRRRRRPACLPRRRRARHHVGADPSALRRALGLRHGACRDQRHAHAHGARRARRRRAGRARQDPRAARSRGEAGARCAKASTASAITVSAQAHLRYAGTDSALPIPVASLRGMQRSVRDRASDSASASSAPRRTSRSRRSRSRRAAAASRSPSPILPAMTARRSRRMRTTPIFTQRHLARGADLPARRACARAHRIAGPALIIEDHQTVVVEPEWQARVTAKQPSPAHPHRQEARRRASASRPIR